MKLRKYVQNFRFRCRICSEFFPKNRRVASLLRIVKLFFKLVFISEQEADGQDHQHASTADYHPGHLKGDFGNSNQGKNDEFVLI